MTRQLSMREKVLVLLVGGTFAFLINWFVLQFFVQTYSTQRKDRALKDKQVAVMQELLANTALWQQRETWLREHQPRIENEATAGVQLLNQVQEIARRHSVTVEQPAIGNPERRPLLTAVAVTLETKCPWEALHQFMAALQGPEQFIVLESVNLRIDPQDQTQMRGRFRIAKWFAPK